MSAHDSHGSHAASPLNPLRSFLSKEYAAGVLLLVASVIAIIFMNSPIKDGFLQVLNIHIGYGPFDLSISHWVQDGLMALFFLFVSLELKRELIGGVLSKPKHAALPVLASLGGTVAPAIFYMAFNLYSGYSHGWSIPTATDIAFSLGVLSLLGNRVPNLLKIFLLALAIVDDLCAVLIIAIGYSQSIDTDMLSLATAVFAVMLMLTRINVRRLEVYWALGLVLWGLMLHSGVHATLAGVLTALAIPYKAHCGPNQPLLVAEHALRPWIQFLIMPFFALCFAGIDFSVLSLDVFTHPVTLGVGAGLLLGKPLGVLGACLMFRWVTGSKLHLPWPKIWGVAFLAGIGFTMSLFMGELAFEDPSVVNEVKTAVYVASLLAGVIGWGILYKVLPRQGHHHPHSSAAPFLTRD